MVVDIGLPPFLVGGKEDAGAAVVGVDAPGEIALAVDLETSRSGKADTVGSVGCLAVIGGRA